MCLYMPGQLFSRCKSGTKGIPRHEELKKKQKKRLEWEGKVIKDWGLNSGRKTKGKTNQGKDKPRKKFVRTEIYLSAEILIIHRSPLLEELQEEEGRVYTYRGLAF